MAENQVERRKDMLQLEADIKDVKRDLVGHEEICAIRYRNIHDSIDKLTFDMNLVFGRLWKSAIGIILLLLTIAGYLYIENNHLQHITTQVEQK